MPVRDPAATVRRASLTAVMAAAVGLVFLREDWLVLAGSGALVVFLAFSCGQFSLGTWVPIILSLGIALLAVTQGVQTALLLQAAGQMVFLGALVAMLATLRSAAAIAPEVTRAGIFLTAQPASRRYLALASGGHLFGVLINFGGLTLLLDLAVRSMATPSAMALPSAPRDLRLRRMTLAIVRGFGLISLWSPFGFATNAILITLPGISYYQFGPIGFALSFVFMTVGWLFDRAEGRTVPGGDRKPAEPLPGMWTGALALLGHVVMLASLLVVLNGLSTLSFQQALIVTVPIYAAVWAGASGLRERGSPRDGVTEASLSTWRRLSTMGPEIGVFASAGLLPVLLLALIPLDAARSVVAELGLGAIPMAWALTVTIIVLAFAGINPIISASVLGAIAYQLAVPGLSPTAIALALTTGWTAALGFSPIVTTVVLSASITGQPAGRIGPVWNGPYSLTILAVSCILLAALMSLGWV